MVDFPPGQPPSLEHDFPWMELPLSNHFEQLGSENKPNQLHGRRIFQKFYQKPQKVFQE